MCKLCGVAEENRIHFLIRCPSLEIYRMGPKKTLTAVLTKYNLAPDDSYYPAGHAGAGCCICPKALCRLVRLDQ